MRRHKCDLEPSTYLESEDDHQRTGSAAQFEYFKETWNKSHMRGVSSYQYQ